MLLEWNEEVSIHYRAYAADVLRSAGVMLHISPATIFRACVILQRFLTLMDNSDEVAKLESLVEKGNDLIKKLSSCLRDRVRMLLDGDMTFFYLFSASLLIPAKLEAHWIRIRHIIHAFHIIHERQQGCRETEIKSLDGSGYEDFKSMMLIAEHLILVSNGFKTFAWTPHNLLLLFSESILDTSTDNGLAAQREWLKSGLQWINDIVRYNELIISPPSLLAIAALSATIPKKIRQDMPSHWTEAFGHTESDVHNVIKMRRSFLLLSAQKSAQISLRELLDSHISVIQSPSIILPSDIDNIEKLNPYPFNGAFSTLQGSESSPVSKELPTGQPKNGINSSISFFNSGASFILPGAAASCLFSATLPPTVEDLECLMTTKYTNGSQGQEKTTKFNGISGVIDSTINQENSIAVEKNEPTGFSSTPALNHISHDNSPNSHHYEKRKQKYDESPVNYSRRDNICQSSKSYRRRHESHRSHKHRHSSRDYDKYKRRRKHRSHSVNRRY